MFQADFVHSMLYKDVNSICEVAIKVELLYNINIVNLYHTCVIYCRFKRGYLLRKQKISG